MCSNEVTILLAATAYTANRSAPSPSDNRVTIVGVTEPVEIAVSQGAAGLGLEKRSATAESNDARDLHQPPPTEM